ncbi:MAG: hypothetical protein RL330_136 [Actinomycetota bacterium]
MARHSFPPVPINDLVASLPGARLAGASPGQVSGVTQDSRQVSRGDLYCCVSGVHHDGHDFVAAAAAAGAAALLVDREVDAGDVPVVHVPSVRAALGPAADFLFGHPSRDLLVCGVTGTNGKTSVATMLGAILAAAGHRPSVMGTLSGERTTPEAIDLHARFRTDRDAGVDAVAMEVSSHALAQHRTDGFLFDVAVLTNIGRDHLDFHGSVEAYVAAKMRLFGPTACRRAVVNLDDPAGRRLADGADVPVTGYSLADIDRVEVGVAAVAFDWRGSRVRTSVGGSFSVANALAAATAAEAVGIPRDAVLAGLAAVEGIRGRFESVPNDAGVDVIVDYAHTPEGLETLLVTARAVAKGRVTVVFGCGGDRDRGKRPLMGAVAAQLADMVVVTSDNPRSEDPGSIIEEILAGTSPAARAEVRACPDRAEAIESALRTAGRGDMVVIAGKGHETRQEIGATTVPFDDAEVARRILSVAGKDERR